MSRGEFGGVAIVAATLAHTLEPPPTATLPEMKLPEAMLPEALLPEAVVDETPLPEWPKGTASE